MGGLDCVGSVGMVGIVLLFGRVGIVGMVGFVGLFEVRLMCPFLFDVMMFELLECSDLLDV